VRRGPGVEEAAFATIDVTFLNARLDPDAFPQSLPVADAFLQALSYAERVGIPVIWIDDPGGLFPPERRPVRDVSSS